ncbi:60S ribosomal protein L27-3 [Hordeum vulgare]|nr:60S ribosomal protein L27-3 [Hordeum vulgare]
MGSGAATATSSGAAIMTGSGRGLEGGDDDGLGDVSDEEEEWIGGGGAGQMGEDRYAGKKAVSMRVFKEGTRDRPYGHCLVAGLAKYPKKVIRKDLAKKTAKKSRVKVFLKLINFTHLMPTRYTLDVDLKEVVSGAPDSVTTKDKKLTTTKSAKAGQARGEVQDRQEQVVLHQAQHDST